MNERIPEPIPFDLTEKTDELKKLIAEHPDYPIVVLTNEESAYTEYAWTYCGNIWFRVAEILDCEPPYESETVCTDRNEFEERVEEWLWDEMTCFGADGKKIEPREEVFQQHFKDALATYEPYWKNVIAVFASN